MGVLNNTKFSLHLYNHKRWEILMIMSVNTHGVIALAGTPCVEYIYGVSTRNTAISM